MPRWFIKTYYFFLLLWLWNILDLIFKIQFSKLHFHITSSVIIHCFTDDPMIYFHTSFSISFFNDHSMFLQGLLLVLPRWLHWYLVPSRPTHFFDFLSLSVSSDSTGLGSVLVYKFELLPPNLRITIFSDFDIFSIRNFWNFILYLLFNDDSKRSPILWYCWSFPRDPSKLMNFLLFWLVLYFCSLFSDLTFWNLIFIFLLQ